jgi:short-subunit dehydrogenase
MPDQSVRSMALITGASSGIGAAYAEALARRGFDLVLVARDRDRLAALGGRLSDGFGVRAEVMAADLLDREDLAAVAQRLSEDARIGLLVNNAGLGPSGPMLGMRPEGADALIGLNVTAMHRLAVAAANAFAGRGRGTIVNIGSVVALMAEHVSPSYAASKAFVLAFTQAMHAELSPRGVVVQAVLPGLTRTEIFERSGRDIASLDGSVMMEAGDLVEAALAGLDAGELVTIPALPDVADWQAMEAARVRLRPNLSAKAPADRYRSVERGRSGERGR